MQSALRFATVVLTVLLLPWQGTAAQERCFCFDWVHHAEFGKECHPTMDACKEAHRRWGNSGMRTVCKQRTDGKCESWGCESPGGQCRRYGCPADAGPPPPPSSPSPEVWLTGTVVSIEPAPPPLSTTSWDVTLKVDKVLIGTFGQDTFAFVAHGPAKAGLQVGRRIQLVAKKTEDGYVVDRLHGITSGTGGSDGARR
jgi:hypothetical protein